MAQIFFDGIEVADGVALFNRAAVVMAPVAASRLSARVVLPAAPWPTRATERILALRSWLIEVPMDMFGSPAAGAAAAHCAQGPGAGKNGGMA
jgi:hypothetical protein